MTRLLLDGDRKATKRIQPGERKSISNERVTFVPANDDATQVVREIFALFIADWRTPAEIAAIFNARGITSPKGKAWNSHKIVRVIENEAYAGTRLYNRTWGRLQQRSRRNPRDEWVVRRNAFPAMIDESVFGEAQERLYWLFPRRWQRGVYATNRVRRLICTDLKAVLVARGMDGENADMAVKALPLVFAVCFQPERNRNWCFLIEERSRNLEYVVGVSVALDLREPIDCFFAIPTHEFNFVNISSISETDECYNRYIVENDKVEEKILSVLP